MLNTTNEQFGQERLAELFLQSADLRASDMLQALLQKASAFGDNRTLADDVTMVALKIAG